MKKPVKNKVYKRKRPSYDVEMGVKDNMIQFRLKFKDVCGGKTDLFKDLPIKSEKDKLN